MQRPFQNIKIQLVRHENTASNKNVSKSNNDTFHKASLKIANKLGSPFAFYTAVLVIFIWVMTGPIFGFSDTWQLLINTGTTIVTFLMVFVIQNTQNRDGKAMQLKLDELINTTHGARSEFVSLEDLSDAELNALHDQFQQMHKKIKQKKQS